MDAGETFFFKCGLNFFKILSYIEFRGFFHWNFDFVI